MPFVGVGLQSITGEHDDVQPSEGVTIQIVRHSDVVVVSHSSSSSGPGGTGGGLIPSQKRHGIQSRQGPAHHMSPKHQNLGISIYNVEHLGVAAIFQGSPSLKNKQLVRHPK